MNSFLKATITTDADTGETAVVKDYVAQKTLRLCRPLPLWMPALLNWAVS